MTFDTTEKSVQDGRPRELYTFELFGGTYRLTTSMEDETLGGNVYTATPGLSRSNISEQPIGNARDVTVTLPVTHAIAAALLANGIPPRTATVTIERFHDSTDTPYRLWRGGIAELTTDEQYARLRVPSLVEIAFDLKVPLLKASRICQHALYGPGCQATRGGANYPVTGVVGTLITLGGLAEPDNTLDGGEIVRVNDNERRTILEQVGSVVRVDVAFPVLANGELANVVRGCDGVITTCRDVFNNVRHFGGHPDLPEVNPTTQQPPKGRSLWDVLKGGG